MPHPNLRHIEHAFDVCVVGGGMAGVCAALAAARSGAKTLIMQDRPMFGGNASSEVRMWVCGANGGNNKETGILEELQLENDDRNPAGNYPVWDGVLHGKIFTQPNLTALLNCSCLDAAMDGTRIQSVTGWQLTTQTYHTVQAGIFIDCSGDSILAPLTGAASRWGRESCDEFDEDIQPPVADAKTMGNTLLIQLQRTQEPQPFVPPPWAYRFEDDRAFAHRMRNLNPANFWWIEIGGLQDTIHDAETIRDELMKTAYGVWDYLKNRAPDREKAANWELYWIGRLPGKRENRRYVGDLILTQNDIEAGGRFDDTVAYGGWPMDDHHPAGMFYPAEPTIFHPAPSPYGIPLRCLYSKNIDNLMFAGRNISVTHAALSSTRVMGTCAVLGQAVGTAAALGVRHRLDPRGVCRHQLPQLQQTLMDHDCFLPGFTRGIDPLAVAADLNGPVPAVDRLLDGMDRDRPDQEHGVDCPLGERIEFLWDQPTRVGMLRCVFDSNLSASKRMPCAYPVRADRLALPRELVRAYRIETRDEAGDWAVVHRETRNARRLVRVPVRARVTGLRFVPESLWGEGEVEGGVARLFGIEPVTSEVDPVPVVAKGESFESVRGRLDPADLAPPAKPAGSVRKSLVGA